MARTVGLIAFALAAFVDQAFALGSSCSADGIPSSSPSTFWFESIQAQGISPLNSDSSYKVRRSVKDYGAVGDGVTDDSAAINSAISDGNRCGPGCVESTLSPGIVYFPSGNYLVKSPIVLDWYTQLVSNPISPASIIGSSDFVGEAIIDADPYTSTGDSTWVNQNNFYKSLRNLVVDMTQLPVDSAVWGIHWQVSQATSIYNLRVEMSQDPATQHKGMFMENGSGGYMGDMVFNGGKTALDLGNQQFTVRNLTVNNAQLAINSNWNWVWTYIGLNINNCQVGVRMVTGGNQTAQTVGANNFVDATITNTPVFIQTTTDQTDSFAGTIYLDNVVLSNVQNAVEGPTGTVVLAGGDQTIAAWTMGNVYEGTTSTAKYVLTSVNAPKKPSSLLDGTGKFVQKTRPQYADVDVSDVVSVRTEGAKGDGSTDDTDALQAVFDKYAGCKLIFFDAGIYMVSKTLKIPAGTRMAGEAWTQLMGFGSNFQDINNPQVVFQIGAAGDKGVIEIADICFTTQGPTPGAIVVEWNVHENDGDQAGAGMWDSFIRLGGAEGTKLNNANCPKLGSQATDGCFAAFLGLHITEQASAYLEGTWVWLADHDIDHDDSSQITLFSGRGILSESAGPVWLVGTASEHHVMYQYHFSSAEDHALFMLQTETPYYQPSPQAPAPFTTDCNYNDPTTFSNGMAWAQYIQDSENILIYGAGHYSFFNNYDETCAAARSCQPQILDVTSNSENIHVFSLSTVGSDDSLSVDEQGVISQDDGAYGYQSTSSSWQLNAS